MRLREKLGGIAAAGLLATISTVGFAGVASADVGSNVTTTPIILPSNAANTTDIQNDEPIQFNIPAGELPDLSTVHIIECSDPGGSISAAVLAHLSSAVCDALTEVTLNTATDGSLLTPDPTDPSDAPGSVVAGNGAVVNYALPNKADLFENSSNAKCDSTDYCIFYIGATPNTPTDGTGVVYSQPFLVDGSVDYLGGTPAGPPAQTPEVPFGVLLPVAAAGLLGGAYVISRRRKVGVTV